MTRRYLSNQAQDCRMWAAEFGSRPEASMFLRLANEFEELANGHLRGMTSRYDEASYLCRRATQECEAATASSNANAKKAHLTLAAAYRSRLFGTPYP